MTMTDRTELQAVVVAKLREQAEYLMHNVATWQLLKRAADEIERLQAEIDSLRAQPRWWRDRENEMTTPPALLLLAAAVVGVLAFFGALEIFIAASPCGVPGRC
jgi:hypothetical protein